MKIKKINSQNRRDFWADMECESCGNIEKDVSGYDDNYYHQHVIPKMECKKCGQKAPESSRPLAPKHSDNIQL